ncbi:MAG: NUDIX domain-containing protein [Patescibacteria group bacterium]
MINFSVNQPEKDKKYFQRIGAYVIIINDNLLATVKTKTGYFLPGGGLEKNESPENCLVRECLEEIGIKIKVIKKISQGNYYFFSTTKQTDMENIGHFYEGKIESVINVQTEKDHELIWLEPKKAITWLYLKNQQEAVRLFLNNN